MIAKWGEVWISSVMKINKVGNAGLKHLGSYLKVGREGDSDLNKIPANHFSKLINRLFINQVTA